MQLVGGLPSGAWEGTSSTTSNRTSATPSRLSPFVLDGAVLDGAPEAASPRSADSDGSPVGTDVGRGGGTGQQAPACQPQMKRARSISSYLMDLQC